MQRCPLAVAVALVLVVTVSALAIVIVVAAAVLPLLSLSFSSPLLLLATALTLSLALLAPKQSVSHRPAFLLLQKVFCPPSGASSPLLFEASPPPVEAVLALDPPV